MRRGVEVGIVRLVIGRFEERIELVRKTSERASAVLEARAFEVG